MDLKEGILTRRSVRFFDKSRPVTEADINEILTMAMYAPSALNTQPWEFVVVKDKEVAKRIASVHPYYQFVADAPASILVCSNVNKEAVKDFWTVDAALAAQNIMLGCHALGMESCWCSIYPSEDREASFSELFDLPPHIRPLTLLVMGYPTKEPFQPHERFDPAKIHYNRWTSAA